MASGFPGGSDGKESACNEEDPWVGKIPWRRAWQPTPVMLPGESLWTEEPGGLQSMGSQRAGHDLGTEQQRRQQILYFSLPLAGVSRLASLHVRERTQGWIFSAPK